VSIVICVLLAAVPDREVLLEQYEDSVLALLPEYGARVRTRARVLDGALTEVQILDFPTEVALEEFRNDPRRLELEEIRRAVIASTTVLRVEDI
jgi:uncharacterized protein (DUF1330 family)